MTEHWPSEAEESVIAAILSAACLSADAGHKVYRRAEAAGLDPAHFGSASYVVLYSTIGRMVEANVPVDPVSVAAELDRDHADAHVIHRLRVLAASVTAFNAVERHAQIVVESAARRELDTKCP